MYFRHILHGVLNKYRYFENSFIFDVLSVTYTIMNVIFAHNVFLLMPWMCFRRILQYSTYVFKSFEVWLYLMTWSQDMFFKILHFRKNLHECIHPKMTLQNTEIVFMNVFDFLQFSLGWLRFWVVLCFVQSLVTTCYAPGLVNNSNLFCHGHKGGWRDGEKQ